MHPLPLTLTDTDPVVVEARQAEKELFDYYGLQARKSFVLLPEQGIRVRVLEFGSGKPLVIVPGNTGDVFPLASLIAQFPGRHVIAINRPGGGLSEGMDHTTVDIRSFAVKTLTTVLDAFQLVDADIVAHSMGAHWSLWLAMDAPKYVRTLSLLGNPGNVMQGKPPLLVRLMGKPPLSHLLFRLIVSSDKNKSLKMLKSMGHSVDSIDRLPASLADCYYFFRKLPHYKVSLLTLLQNAAPQIDAVQLRNISKPVLFLLGTRDRFASVAAGTSISAAIPQCTFIAIEGAGHLPWLDNPEECGKPINAFIAR